MKTLQAIQPDRFKAINPSQRKPLERFGSRVNKLGSNFAVCTAEGQILLLCEDGGFRSSRMRVAEIACEILAQEDSPRTQDEPVVIRTFGGYNTMLAGVLTLAVHGSCQSQGRVAALVDLGDTSASVAGTAWASAGLSLHPASARVYLAEMLGSLLESFQGVAKAEKQMEVMGSELAQVYEELVLLHKLGTHMKLTQSHAHFLQMACESLTEVVSVEGIAVLLDRPVHGQRRLELAAGSGLIDIDDRMAEMVYSRLVRELNSGQEALIDSGVFGTFKYEWPKALNNILAVPMVGSDAGGLVGQERSAPQIVGLMVAANTIQKRDFDSTDIKLFNSVANGCAIFIENIRLFTEMKDLFIGALRALTSSIDAKDGYTHGHSERVALISRWLAEQAVRGQKLKQEQIHQAYFAGLLHDIGKIGIEDWVLRKTGPLTDQERRCIGKHPLIGAGILRGIKQMREIVPAVLSHHERVDGKGYPEGLSGEAIPIVARIVGLADSFDAMTSRRSYRQALSVDDAMEEIRRNMGLQFDAALGQLFLDGDVQGLWKAIQAGGDDLYDEQRLADYGHEALGSLIG